MLSGCALRPCRSNSLVRPFYQEDLPGSIFLPCWPNGSAGPATARFEEGLAVSSQTRTSTGNFFRQRSVYFLGSLFKSSPRGKMHHTESQCTYAGLHTDPHCHYGESPNDAQN